MANLLCFDFDDTITLDNTTRMLFEHFAESRWRDAEDAYHRGELSVEQFNAAALDCVDVSYERAELAEAVLTTVVVRDGFVELVDWAHWNDFQCIVVSNGFDLYVEPVLDRLGLDRVARHAGRTTRDYRWRVKYLSPRGIEVQRGFKLSYAQAFRNAGDFVVYFGDGESDVPAARQAPVVFARSTLLARVEGEHERVFAFETFHDVRAVLEQEVHGWLRSFSSTTVATD